VAVTVAGIAAEALVYGTFDRDDVISAIGDLFDLETDLRAHLPPAHTSRDDPAGVPNRRDDPA
jgi:hypothetical protein